MGIQDYIFLMPIGQGLDKADCLGLFINGLALSSNCPEARVIFKEHLPGLNAFVLIILALNTISPRLAVNQRGYFNIVNQTGIGILLIDLAGP